jgi:hypothetical protein
MRCTALLLLLLMWLQGYAQNDSIKKITWSAYAELYYSYDFSKPQNHEKPNFIYNHKRHNEVNANLLLLKASYLDNHYRANIGLMAGNYSQYNLSAEPAWAQFIYEANIGIKVSKKHAIWLDAGIMPSHIGFESAVSADCWTLTRSMLAENSPYFQTGLKAGYTSANGTLNINALFLNGWQKISKPNYLQKPSFGTQISYKPSNKLLLNYSTFLGTDKPDSMHAFRHFHNFYLQYEPTSKFGIIAGIDIGVDKYNRFGYGTWYSPVLILRQMIAGNTAIALRGEYYADPKQIIITTGTANGFKTFALSANVDVNLHQHIKWRVEGKMYHAMDKIFNNQQYNYSITTNLSIKL